MKHQQLFPSEKTRKEKLISLNFRTVGSAVFTLDYLQSSLKLAEIERALLKRTEIKT